MMTVKEKTDNFLRESLKKKWRIKSYKTVLFNSKIFELKKKII